MELLPTVYYCVQRKYSHENDWRIFAMSTADMKFYLEMLKIWERCRREGFENLKIANSYLRKIKDRTANKNTEFRVIRITYIPEIIETV